MEREFYTSDATVGLLPTSLAQDYDILLAYQINICSTPVYHGIPPQHGIEIHFLDNWEVRRFAIKSITARFNKRDLANYVVSVSCFEAPSYEGTGGESRVISYNFGWLFDRLPVG